MTDEELRREGRAEAVARIVLSRRFPRVDAETWCDLLDVNRDDIRGALERLRGRPLACTKPVAVRKHPGNPGPRQARECPFCQKAVQHGQRWVNHMAALHAAEWAAHLKADMEARYGATCPDCGENIKVTVTVDVEHHVCSHHAAAGQDRAA